MRDAQQPMQRHEDDQRDQFSDPDAALDRLMQEINILRLEGSLFCFDPKQAKRRTGPLTFNELKERPVSIEPHPSYGQPSVLAYRVLQAIFLKMTAEGYPYPGTVSFSMRELARLAGRSSWGKTTGLQLYHAIRQLRATTIHCSFHNKETKEWELAEFNVLTVSYFAGKRSQANFGSVTVHPLIERSINKQHVAHFNLARLSSLDTIGMVLYKRVFFHLSNLYGPRTHRDHLRYEKAYEDICREWLGGLKLEKFKSKILQNQLGRHLEGLRRTRLIRRCDIEERADRSGFKLVFYPGSGFFADYQAYYLERQQPRFRFAQTADLVAMQRPLEAVGYFHEALGHEHNSFEEKEVAYAAQLLREYTPAEVRDLVQFTIEKAAGTGFKMRYFGAVSTYLAEWQADRSRQLVRQSAQRAIKECRHCNEQGMLYMKNRSGAFSAFPCPHDIEKITAFETGQGLQRV